MSDLAPYNAPPVRPPCLDGTPLVYHEAYKFLICTECQVGVFKSPVRIAAHFAQSHPGLPPFPQSPLPLDVHSDQHPVPVRGPNGALPTRIAALSVDKGYSCTSCHYATTSALEAKRHAGKCGSHRVAHLQTFYVNGRKFAVHVPGDVAAPPDESAAGTELSEAFQCVLNSSDIATQPLTTRQPRVGIKRLGWPKLVHSLKYNDIHKLVRPAYDEDEPLIQAAERLTLALFQALHSQLVAGDSYLQTVVFGDQHKILKGFQQPQTIQRYGSILAKFVVFAARVFLDQAASLLPHAINMLSPQCKSRFETIRHALATNVPDDELVTPMVDLVHLLFFETTVICATDTSNCLLAVYLPLKFVLSGGQLAAASTIKGDLAKYDYGARLVLFTVWQRRIRSISPADGWQARLDDMVALCKAELNTTPNAYLFLVGCRQVISSEALSQELKHNVEFVDLEGHVLRVGSSTISIATISKTVRHVVSRAWTVLQEGLMLGMQWDRMVAPVALTDDFANTRVGYSFLDNPANQFGPDRRVALFQGILSDPQLAGEFGFRVTPTGLSGHATRLHRYLNTAQDFRMLLMTAIHLSYGAPARGTELASTRIVNSPTAKRDVIIVGGRVAFVNLYNKTNAVTGRMEVVPRMLCAALSELVIQYLCLVRPLEIVIDHLLRPNATDRPLEWFLFVVDNDLVSTQAISKHLSNSLASYGSHRFGVSAYRQAVSALSRRNGIALDSESLNAEEQGRENDEAAWEEQFGHSLHMGRMVYGRDKAHWDGLDPVRMLKINQMIDKWAQLLGLVNFQPELVDELPKVQPPAAAGTPAFIPQPQHHVKLTRPSSPGLPSVFPLSIPRPPSDTKDHPDVGLLPSPPPTPIPDSTHHGQPGAGSTSPATVQTPVRKSAGSGTSVPTPSPASLLTPGPKSAGPGTQLPMPPPPTFQTPARNSLGSATLLPTPLSPLSPAPPTSPISSTEPQTWLSDDTPQCPSSDLPTLSTPTRKRAPSPRPNADSYRSSKVPRGSLSSSLADPVVGVGTPEPLLPATLRRTTSPDVPHSSVQQYQTVFKRFPQFRTAALTTQQLAAIYTVQQAGPGDAVSLILPTGSGKTLIYAVLAKVDDPTGITVILSPSVKLVHDLVRRISAMGIRAAQWQPDCHSIDSGVVALTMDRAVGNCFIQWAQQNEHRISRVVFEEAHEVLDNVHSSYRSLLYDVDRLSATLEAVPFVVVTATSPPSTHPKLLKTLGLDRAHVVRAPVLPCHLRFAVYPIAGLSQARAVPHVVSLVQHLFEHWVSDHGQILIFVPSVHLVKVVGPELDKVGLDASQFYSAGYSDMDQQLQAFITGQGKRVAVSTSFLSAGVDFSALEVVIIVGVPSAACTLLQQAGRAGRSPKSVSRALSILLPTSTQFTANKAHQYLDRIALADMASPTVSCRRTPLHQHFDGIDADCLSMSAELCDVCSVRSGQWPLYFPFALKPNQSPGPTRPRFSPPPSLTISVVEADRHYRPRNDLPPSTHPPSQQFKQPATSSPTAPCSPFPPPTPGPSAPYRRHVAAAVPTSHPQRLAGDSLALAQQAVLQSPGPLPDSPLSLGDQLFFVVEHLFKASLAKKTAYTSLSVPQQSRQTHNQDLAEHVRHCATTNIDPLRCGECVYCFMLSLLPSVPTNDITHDLWQCTRKPLYFWDKIKPFRSALKCKVPSQFCKACFMPYKIHGKDHQWHGHGSQGCGIDKPGSPNAKDNDRQHIIFSCLFSAELIDDPRPRLLDHDSDYQKSIMWLTAVGVTGNLVAAEAISWLRGRPVLGSLLNCTV